ncbi:MAG: helix-turn-helix domain-containing protein [archaeon]
MRSLRTGDDVLESVRIWSKLDSIQKHDALAMLYGLTETEALAYFSLLEEGAINVNELRGKLGRDRTTVQRTLAKLVRENLAQRRKINLAKGGIKYCYEAVPFSIVKQEMTRRLESWYSLSKTRIQEL